MVDRNRHLTFLQPGDHLLISSLLFLCKRFICFICLGKMSKDSFYHNMRQLCNLCDRICRLLRHLKTDTAHAGIQFDMDLTDLILSHCFLRQLFCTYQRKNCRTQIFLYDLCIVFRKRIAQDQNRFFDSVRIQFLRFFRRCDCVTPDILPFFHDFCKWNGTVPVTICLHHGNNLRFLSDTAMYFIQIMC